MINAKSALAVLLALLWATPALAQKQEQRDIDLVVGGTKSISAAKVTEFLRSDKRGRIAGVDMNSRKTRFVISGRSEGTATLTLIMENGSEVVYTINVRARIASGSVGARDNIRLDLYFVQLTNRNNLQIGLGWPALAGGTGSFNYTIPVGPGAPPASGSIALASSVLPRIDLAHTAGWVRILRRASIIVANGENGSYNSGGELNFRITAGLTIKVHTIEFGSVVSVQPRYDRRSGRLEIRISADVSEIEEGEDIPGRTVSRVDTVVNLKLGESIMLAGLRSERTGHTRVGLPWLSQLPIVGALFGSHGSRSEEVENLLFIVPSVIESVSLEKHNRVRDALRAYRDFSGAWPDVKLLGPAPGDEER